MLCRAAAKGREHSKGSAARRRLGSTLGSVVLASLLLCEVAAAIVGAQAVFFSILVAAGWSYWPLWDQGTSSTSDASLCSSR
jgi:hypothetical protein